MAYIYMFKQLWRYAGPERWKIVVYYLFHTISVLGEFARLWANYQAEEERTVPASLDV